MLDSCCKERRHPHVSLRCRLEPLVARPTPACTYLAVDSAPTTSGLLPPRAKLPPRIHISRSRSNCQRGARCDNVGEFACCRCTGAENTHLFDPTLCCRQLVLQPLYGGAALRLERLQRVGGSPIPPVGVQQPALVLVRTLLETRCASSVVTVCAPARLPHRVRTFLCLLASFVRSCCTPLSLCCSASWDVCSAAASFWRSICWQPTTQTERWCDVLPERPTGERNTSSHAHQLFLNRAFMRCTLLVVVALQHLHLAFQVLNLVQQPQGERIGWKHAQRTPPTSMHA